MNWDNQNKEHTAYPAESYQRTKARNVLARR
jgi:hypothetical protein